MITTFKLPVDSGFLIVAYYRQANKPIVYSKLTIDSTLADNHIRQVKKEVLREKVSKFLSHRQSMMDNYGALKTSEKYNALDKIKKNFSFLEKHTLTSNCKLIVDFEDLLRILLPGETSVFHQGQKDALMEILSFCKLELKIAL